MRLNNLIISGIIVFLFSMPFFWYKPGELDIGGDSSRLYLYDANNYLRSTGLFVVDPQGTAKINSAQLLLPYLFLQTAFNALVHSPYIINGTEKSVKLVLSFYFMYLIVRELLHVEFGKRHDEMVRFASILSGLFYVFSSAVTDNMPYALFVHNQVFIYPMVFFYLLHYILTQETIYLWLVVLLSFIFSYCFSLTAAPPPFAFFPFAFMFLFIYVKVILKKSIVWKHVFAGFIAFLSINAFHLLPSVLNIIAPGSYLHARAIESATKANPGLAYFNALLPMAKVSTMLVQLHGGFIGIIAALTIPLSLLLGLFFYSPNTKKHTLHLLTLFFLVTLFFESANIMDIGVAIYRFLFSVPGFSMFRNFFGQFQFVYIFFYALLFGYSIGVLFQRMKLNYVCLLSTCLAVIIIGKSWNFVTGSIATITHRQSRNVKIVVAMDPQYEKTLSFIRALPADGKILTLPLSDYYMQVVHGVNSGAYMGPSSISFLTGKNDFAGYQILDPFAETVMKLSRERNFSALRTIFALLNIRYIFYNEDPSIYESAFPGYPYDYMRTSLPKTQAEYKEYLNHFPTTAIYHQGSYSVFDFGQYSYLPHISMPRYIYKNIFDIIDPTQSSTMRETDCVKFFSEDACANTFIDLGVSPSIVMRKINPTKYYVEVKNIRSPVILVLSDSFDPSWRLYEKTRSGWLSNFRFLKSVGIKIFGDANIFETLLMQPLPHVSHFMMNEYANAWYITPDMLHGANAHTFIIETSVQKMFYVSAAISIVSLCLFIGFGIYLLAKFKKML